MKKRGSGNNLTECSLNFGCESERPSFCELSSCLLCSCYNLVRHTVIMGLLAYGTIQLGMAIEAGAGRDKANLQQTRECKREISGCLKWRFRPIKANFAEVQG